MLILAVKVMLSLIILVWVVWPFIVKKEETKTSPVDDVLYKLNQQKELAYAAIKELDFDYNMGKLSEEDYNELKRQYKLEAVSVLQRIDQLKNSGGVGIANG